MVCYELVTVMQTKNNMTMEITSTEMVYQVLASTKLQHVLWVLHLLQILDQIHCLLLEHGLLSLGQRLHSLILVMQVLKITQQAQ